MTGTIKKIIRQKGFTVKVLAEHVGLDVRTLEWRFSEQFRTTPKAWIIRERSFLPPRSKAVNFYPVGFNTFLF